MTGLEALMGVGSGLLANRISERAKSLRETRGWSTRLARAAARNVDFGISRRTLKRLLKSRPLQEALERLEEASDHDVADLVQPALESRRGRASHVDIDRAKLELAKTLRLEFLRHLDQAYRDQVMYSSLANRIDALKPTMAATQSQSGLPPTCVEKLDLLRHQDPGLADRIEQLLKDPALMRAGAIEEFAESTPPWFDSDSHLAWEVLGDFAAAYGFGRRLRVVYSGCP